MESIASSDPEAPGIQRTDQGDPMDEPILINDSGMPVTLRQLQSGNISSRDFHSCLALYDHHVRDIYQDLEIQRFERIPEALRNQHPPFLTRDEVLDLDRWVQYVSKAN